MIMHDRPVAIESRYGVAIEIMKQMHWSWQDLISAPASLVEEIAIRLAQTSKWEAERRKLDAAMNQ